LHTTVLRLEAEVEDFVLNSTEPSHNFSGELSSYDRLLVHRTAQHWGLDTSTLSQGPDHGSILAVRTVHTGPPQIKLTDLPVTMEEPVIPVPSLATGDGDGGSAPKVLVRRRGDRPRGSGNSNHSPRQRYGFNQQNHAASIEEKEMNYERARARIFGAGGNGEYTMSNPGDTGGGVNNAQGMYPQQHMMPQHQQMMMANHFHAMQMQQLQQHVGNAGGGGGGGQGQGHAYNASGTPHDQHPQDSNHSVGNNARNGANNTTNGATNNNNFSNNNTNSTKAQLRNRQEDLSDPDFRRGRRNMGPRFDPGFGEDMMMMNGGGQGQGMYVRPTYSSEFPTLGGGGGGGGGYPNNPHQASPRAGGGYMLPYAYPGQGSNLHNGAAPGYPVHAGHMYAAAAGAGAGAAGSGGPNNNNPGAHQMQMQMQYQQQQGYPMALGPYGHYVPMRPGDGTGGMVPVMYMNNGTAGPQGSGTGNGPAMYHPGSPSDAMNDGGGGGGGGMQHMMPMSPSAAMASPKGGGSGGGGGAGGHWNQYQQQHNQQYYHHSGGNGGGNRQQQQQQQQQQRGGGASNSNTSQLNRNQQRGMKPPAESSSGAEKPPPQQQKQST